MLNNELFPDFHAGEEVVVLDKDGTVAHRGPLMLIEHCRFMSLKLMIGTEEVHISTSWSNERMIFNARRYDLYMQQQIVSELGDVAEKYLKYATQSLSAEQCNQVRHLVDQLTELVSPVCTEEYETRGTGVSPASFQGMWGNRALTADEIDAKLRRDLVFNLRNQMRSVLEKIESLENPYSVVAFPRGEVVIQSALENTAKS